MTTVKRILCLLVLLAGGMLAAASIKTGMPVKSLPSPVFLDGSNRVLSEFLGKKIVVLYIWEMNNAALEDFAKLPAVREACKDSAEFIGIGIGSTEKLKKFPGVMQLGIPVNVDKGAVKNLFLRDNEPTPLAVVLAKDGTLLWRGPLQILPRIVKQCAAGKFDLQEQIRVEVFTDAVNEAIRAEKLDQALSMLKTEYAKHPQKLELLRVQMAILKKLKRFGDAFKILQEAQLKRPKSYRIFEMEYQMIADSRELNRLPDFFSRLKKNFANRPGVLLGFALSECQLPPDQLNFDFVIDLIQTGWESSGFASKEERGMYALEYAKILHSIGRNDIAAMLAKKAITLLAGKEQPLLKAKAAFTYYTKMMQIAPKVKVPDLKK